MITKFNNFKQINENMKLGKQFVAQSKISQQDLEGIVNIDPSKTKKYVGWLAKQFIASAFDPSDLKSLIEEYHVLSEKGKVDPDKKDIHSFNNIEELTSYVDNLNQRGTASLKELETDFDVVLDTNNFYIARPNTHEASRKLGLTTFAHRKNNDGSCDSAWCTTYKNNTHFHDYFYKQNVTFYYIWVKNPKLVKELGGEKYSKVAFAVLQDGRIDAYDAEDKQMPSSVVDKINQLVAEEK